MHKINIEGMQFHAYHGCLEEEARIGGQYQVDVFLCTDFTEAAKTDDLTKTIDYCGIYEICKTEMLIRSKLIEQVGQRIFNSLKSNFASIKTLHVRIIKFNPPINGDVLKVSIEITD